MVLLFDIDNVIRDWAGSANRVLTSVGYDLKPMSEWGWGVDTWLKEPLPKEEVEDLIFNKLAEDIYVGADEIPQARRVLTDLYWYGHEVILISNQFNSNIQQYTTQWLEDHNIMHTGRVYTRFKENIHGHLFIDDKPENIKAMEKSANIRLLYNQPWNKTGMGNDRVYDWIEIEHLVNFLQRGLI